MDIDRILRKLAPLLPEETRRWKESRALVDGETRALLDRHILSTAYRLLGDLDAIPFLSFPRKGYSRGSVHLGKVVYGDKRRDFYLPSKLLVEHTLILGRSGAGKTNTVLHLLRQLLVRDIGVVCFDFKRTYREILAVSQKPVDIYTVGRNVAPLPFNPFLSPPGLEPHVHAAQVTDIMAQTFTLGDGAKSLLQRLLMESHGEKGYNPTPGALLEALRNVAEKERVSGWKTTLARALETLNLAQLVGGEPTSQEAMVAGLLDGRTILEMDSVSQATGGFLVAALWLWMYHVRLSRPQREQLKTVLVLEEAHNVLGRQERRTRESIMEMLLRQCRELSLGVVVVDQQPSLLSTVALNNCHTSLCLNMKNPADIRAAAGVSALEEGDTKWLSRLATGQAVLRLQSGWHEPMLLEVPPVSVKKGIVTDALLARHMRQRKSDSKVSEAVAREIARVPRGPLCDRALDDRSIGFLYDVVLHPADGVKVRYRRAGFGAGTGNRLKRRLVEQGWLEEAVIPRGRTRTHALRLTKEAKDLLGVREEGATREGLEHSYWKHFYAERLRERGWTVQLEAPRRGGFADIMAERDGKQIHVEIETGRSDFLGNLKSNLAEGAELLILIATSEAFERKLTENLQEFGLHGVERIHVLRAGSGLGI